MNLSCSTAALVTSLLGLGCLVGLGHYYGHHRGYGGMMAKMHHEHHGEHSRENMQKKCDEGFKIINCHKRCGEDMKCHDSCPLPECPKMAAKVKEVIQCNAKCGSDFACRTSCNLPVKRFVEMCTNLNKPHFEDLRPPPAQFIVSNFQTCQTQCAGNVECMKGCPKPFWLKFKKTCRRPFPSWNAISPVGAIMPAM